MAQETPAALPRSVQLTRYGLQALSYTLPPLAVTASLNIFSTPTRLPVTSGKTKRILETATRSTLPFKGGNLAVYTWGTGSRRVLLFHGWQGQAGSFREFVPALLAEGFQVVAVDAPAHGESDGEQATLVLFMEALREIERVLGRFEVIIGHSLGAMSTLFLCGERTPITPERIVLIGAAKNITIAFENFARFMGLPPRILNGMYRRLESRHDRYIQDYSAEHYAPRVSIPVLVVHDTQDLDVPFEHGQAIAEHLPNVELFVTEGLGHQRILRDANVVRRVVSFASASA